MKLGLILGDQLSLNLPTLRQLSPKQDRLLMLEVKAEGTYVKHHRQKIALILSAMRHFRDELRAAGWQVDYITLDDPANTQSLPGEIARALTRHAAKGLVCTSPGEWRVLELLRQLPGQVKILEDTRFIATPTEFANWAKGRKQLRMEFFYREMRRKTGLLMKNGEPEGGEWNYDNANREPYREGELLIPPAPVTEPDAITHEVIDLVEQHFPDHFGNLTPFRWATTREAAEAHARSFLETRLPRFGRYQDAMVKGQDFMFHSLVSPYLNIGLLDPLTLCQAAEKEYLAGRAPLAAVEGFIRQIIGWREYIRGIYWLKMPAYAELNFFNNQRPLPAFYWDETHTDMTCLQDCIRSTRENAYAHHIQRLMVTGNFALLAGIDIKEITDWYLAVYADAFEWVELPNTLGMVMFADGGLLASKPYAASGKYIARMSNYCDSCRYDPNQVTGPRACPLNFLYWNFLATHRDKLQRNPRMGMMYASLDRMTPEKQKAITAAADQFLASLSPDKRY